jgi:hypothetical protein
MIPKGTLIEVGKSSDTVREWVGAIIELLEDAEMDGKLVKFRCIKNCPAPYENMIINHSIRIADKILVQSNRQALHFLKGD